MTEQPAPAVDTETMRDTIQRLLGEHTEQPDEGELDRLTALLRGHIELLIPEVEHAARPFPADDMPRFCALACVREARAKLHIEPRPQLSSRTAHARRLARVTQALLGHYETLAADDSRPCGEGR